MNCHYLTDTTSCTDTGVTLEDLAWMQNLGNQVHWSKKRKVQPQNRYWSHPALTAGLVAKVGGGLRAACIAVGHDVIEESGIEMLEVLREKSPELWKAIWLLTPPLDEAHLTWLERKTKTLERMKQIHHDPDLALVAAADKWATLFEMNCDIDNLGIETVWNRMKAWDKPLLWYYEEALNVLREKIPDEMVVIYERELNGFRRRHPLDWNLSVGG